MLELNNINIKKRDNNQMLLKDFNLLLNKNDKCAIIGEEGNGKSTLLKAIYNKEEVLKYANIKGTIRKPNIIGYLSQSFDSIWDNYSVRDYFFKRNIKADYNYDLYNDYDKLINLFLNLNLDISFLNNEQLIKTLSGGEKVKISLIKILLEEPDLILLDEPTNDLDIETLIFLEIFINKTEIPILFVSHDETLLENTANMIVHLEQIKRKTEVRNIVLKEDYKTYISNRENIIKKYNQEAIFEKREYKKQKKILKGIKTEVTKQNPERQNRMRQMLAKEKQLENKEIKDKYDLEETIKMFFEENIKVSSSKIIIDYQDNLSLENGKIIANIKLVVKGGSKIVITGKNGIGKTTLLKDIYNKIKNREDIRVGYMPQNYEEILNLNESPLSYLLTKINDKTKIMTVMGSLNFTYEEMTGKIMNLSGGTKAKLIIAELILLSYNVLILDEPTRNLSPLSNPEVRKLFKSYNGTIISVSHDRKFISEVSNMNYELNENGLEIKTQIEKSN